MEGVKLQILEEIPQAHLIIVREWLKNTPSHHHSKKSRYFSSWCILFDPSCTKEYHLLSSFEQNIVSNILTLKQAEKYICSIFYAKENSDIFDDSQDILYTRETKRLHLYHLLFICYMDIFLDDIMSF